MSISGFQATIFAPFMVAAHDGLVLDRPAKQLPRCQSGQGEQSDPDIDLC